MEFFRPLHRKHYDSEHDGCGFASVALDLRRREPFSVVETVCAEHASETICAHIARFYDRQTGVPKIYWPIPEGTVPMACRIEPETTASGDTCHRNIHDWGKERIRRVFKRLTLSDLIVCLPEGERPLTETDLGSTS